MRKLKKFVKTHSVDIQETERLTEFISTLFENECSYLKYFCEVNTKQMFYDDVKVKRYKGIKEFRSGKYPTK